MAEPGLQYDRFLIVQLVRPVAFVRERRLSFKEDSRFFADEREATRG